MRAFVALTPPPAALDELAAAVAPLRAAHPDLRWAPPAQWHLTLAFLGEIDEAVLPELTARLARAARRFTPLSLALAGGGRFGDRVLWTRVHGMPAADPRELRVPPGELRISPGESRASPGESCISPGESCVPPGRIPHSDRASSASRRRTPSGGSTQALRRLAQSVTAAARRCGIDVDERPYRPHLTVARGREGVDLRPAVAALSGFAGSPWTADELHLVRSRLGAGPGGTAAHEIVAAWPWGR